VALYVDGVRLATVEEPPFEVYWPLEEGEHMVSARGVTAEGQAVTSGEIPFTVNPAE
jgi:hypothetical protein